MQSTEFDAALDGRDHPARKFSHPDITAKGEQRASVSLDGLETLWINTGTLCNIECVNCYIESGPKNDRLAYITAAEAIAYFDEITALGLGTSEIGFTGGEPFMNKDIIAMAGEERRLAERLGEHHRDRVGLLARRAAGAPHADRRRPAAATRAAAGPPRRRGDPRSPRRGRSR